MSDSLVPPSCTLHELTSLTIFDDKFIKHLSRLHKMLNPNSSSPPALITQLQTHYAPRYVNPPLSRLFSRPLNSTLLSLANSLIASIDINFNACPSTTIQVSLGPYILSLSPNSSLLFAIFSKPTKSLSFTHCNAIQLLLIRQAIQGTSLTPMLSSNSTLTTPESLFTLLKDILLIMRPQLYSTASLLPKCTMHLPTNTSSPYIHAITTRLMVIHTLPKYVLTYVQSRLPTWIQPSIRISNHQQHTFYQMCEHSFLNPTTGHSYGLSSFHGRIDLTISQLQWTKIQTLHTDETDSSQSNLIPQFTNLTLTDVPQPTLQHYMSRLPLEIYHRILTTYLASFLSSANHSFIEAFTLLRRHNYNRIILFVTLIDDPLLYPGTTFNAINISITYVYPHAHNTSHRVHCHPHSMFSEFPREPLVLPGPTMPLEIIFPSSLRYNPHDYFKEIESCIQARFH
jgi:hypothetical protein